MAAAAGPLDSAKRAAVEVLSFWVWVADMVDVSERCWGGEVGILLLKAFVRTIVLGFELSTGLYSAFFHARVDGGMWLGHSGGVGLAVKIGGFGGEQFCY